MAEIDWPDVEERIILRRNYLEELINKALPLPEEWRGDSFRNRSFGIVRSWEFIRLPPKEIGTRKAVIIEECWFSSTLR